MVANALNTTVTVPKDSMRKKQTAVNKQQRNQLVYEDYKWQELVTENKLGSLQVSELNKYLDKHHMENIKHKRKSDKVSAIRRHVLQEELFGIDNTEGEAVDDGMESEDSEGDESEVMDEDTRESSEGESDDSNGADSEDNDEVVGMFGSETDTEDEEVQIVVTRGGRRAGTELEKCIWSHFVIF